MQTLSMVCQRSLKQAQRSGAMLILHELSYVDL